MAHRSLVIFKWNYQIILQIHLNTYSDAVICWRFVARRLERNATGFDALDWWSGPEMSLLIDSATAPTVIESGKKETFFSDFSTRGLLQRNVLFPIRLPATPTEAFFDPADHTDLWRRYPLLRGGCFDDSDGHSIKWRCDDCNLGR